MSSPCGKSAPRSSPASPPAPTPPASTSPFIFVRGAESLPVVSLILTRPDGSLPPAKVSAEERTRRRAICRSCDGASRDPDPRFAEFNGVTTESICLPFKAMHPDRPCLLRVGTTLVKAECPRGLW